ncbi:hypothetical protein BpHYR1_002547 [Brachionus plicatilis]|uniref:Uncharacterized protein n=1 Tax=Brachionus plicatilis TaxID=10195 RepID=A0A3M7QQF6_BRAPC|nr:hypothetical protein BpHYR1_002547 [Brachionus plicatilis]
MKNLPGIHLHDSFYQNNHPQLAHLIKHHTLPDWIQSVEILKQSSLFSSSESCSKFSCLSNSSFFLFVAISELANTQDLSDRTYH